MTFQISPKSPFTNMIPAKMELRRLFRVSFILENGIAIEMSDHTSPAPINIKGVMFWNNGMKSAVRPTMNAFIPKAIESNNDCFLLCIR